MEGSISSCERCRKARKLVEEQAEDEGLWFKAGTAAESYLMRALRLLHAAVEGEDPPLVYDAELGAIGPLDEIQRTWKIIIAEDDSDGRSDADPRKN